MTHLRPAEAGLRRDKSPWQAERFGVDLHLELLILTV